jgi:hypothetical protein
MIFPALPGATDGFTLLAFEPDHFLIIGCPSPGGGAPLMTWAFVLEEAATGLTRLIVRARVGPGYEFHKFPWWIGKRIARIVHFVMQRKQLLGIARRAEPSVPAVGDGDTTDSISRGTETAAFQCTNHDSEYTPDGTYTKGHATRNLDR